VPATTEKITSTEDVAKKTHPNFHLINSKQCGLVRSDRITGGEEAELNQYPWSALLKFNDTDGSRFLCGGSLISDQYVLTGEWIQC